MEDASSEVSVDDLAGCYNRLLMGFLGHAATIGTLSYAIRFWSRGEKRALFLRHEGFLYVPSLLLF